MPKVSPIIHIKQSLMDKGGHRPFTAEFNAKGRIQPEPLLKAFADGGAEDNEICLELSFKEREPNDRQVIPQIAESVAFWAPHIDTGAADLTGLAPSLVDIRVPRLQCAGLAFEDALQRVLSRQSAEVGAREIGGAAEQMAGDRDRQQQEEDGREADQRRVEPLKLQHRAEDHEAAPKVPALVAACMRWNGSVNRTSPIAAANRKTVPTSLARRARSATITGGPPCVPEAPRRRRCRRRR